MDPYLVGMDPYLEGMNPYLRYGSILFGNGYSDYLVGTDKIVTL